MIQTMQPAKLPLPKANLQDWVFEPKFDGVRALWVPGLGLRSRKDFSLNTIAPTIAEALADYPHVLDGELVSLFGRSVLWRDIRRDKPSPDLYYVVFDTPSPRLREHALSTRQNEVSFAVEYINFPQIIDIQTATTFFPRDLVEGVVAKKLASPYVSGKSNYWIKSIF